MTNQNQSIVITTRTSESTYKVRVAARRGTREECFGVPCATPRTSVVFTFEGATYVAGSYRNEVFLGSAQSLLIGTSRWAPPLFAKHIVRRSATLEGF